MATTHRAEIAQHVEQVAALAISANDSQVYAVRESRRLLLGGARLYNLFAAAGEEGVRNVRELLRTWVVSFRSQIGTDAWDLSRKVSRAKVYRAEQFLG